MSATVDRLVVSHRWLWELIASASASRPDGQPVRTVTLHEGGQVAEVATLLGRRDRPEVPWRVPVAQLDRTLSRLEPPVTVAELVAAVGGPARSNAAAAAEHERARDEVVDRLTERLPPRFRGWADTHARGALARHAGAHDVDGQRRAADLLVRVAGALPADRVPLPLFAPQVLGHTKALGGSSDDGSVETLVLSMLTGGRVPTSAHERRAVWEGQGVVTDGLSSTVLCYRLPLDVGTAAGRVVAAYGPFEPAVLPWRLLAGGVVPSGPPSTLWVCEGPALVERVAAERLPVALLCFEGLVAHSHRQMVAAFVAAGWQVAVSADHEPRALRSAAALFEVAGRAARPWALDAAAHRRGSHDRGRDIPVGVPVPATPWDPGLAAAIRSDRRRVTEEGKVGMLLAALAESDQAT